MGTLSACAALFTLNQSRQVCPLAHPDSHHCLKPCIARGLLEENERLFLHPSFAGVLLPNMRDETSALKLALLGAVRDGVVPDTALVSGMACLWVQCPKTGY